MKQIYKIIAISILIGTLLGFLIAVSIKYPLNRDVYDMAEKTCKTHDDWKTMKIAINGKVHSIICNDSTHFRLN